MALYLGNKLVAGSSTGLEIGDIGFAPLGIDETKNKRRYLNGQVIIQAQFETFTNKVKERAKLYPNIITTEENWQAEITNSKLGQCGKFVIDDTLGTIRLPKVINIQGLQDLNLLGGIKAESLPNIKGTSSVNALNTNTTGAFYTVDKQIAVYGSTVQGIALNFDASLSSSTYQDNAPVQQEAVQYPYFIQVSTGTEETVDVTREIELNNPFSLLDYKWSEYELNNTSWLLSNGAFHSGTVYKSVYELLLKIHNGTETKDGVSVKLSTEEYTDTDFVLNTDDTTFRLPIKVKLASGNAVVGNGMTLGLTAGQGDNRGLCEGASNYLCAGPDQYGSNIGITVTNNPAGSDRTLGITTDPEYSGIETSSSGLKLYFYVGETIQDANVIAASQVLTTLADCVKKSSATDRETVVGWGMPDWSRAKEASGAYTSSNQFTAPCDGLLIYGYWGTASGKLYVNDVVIGGMFGSGTGHGMAYPIVLPLSKGDRFYQEYANNTAFPSSYNRFIPFKGAK